MKRRQFFGAAASVAAGAALATIPALAAERNFAPRPDDVVPLGVRTPAYREIYAACGTIETTDDRRMG